MEIAIRSLTSKQLKNLTLDERADILEEMYLEDWSETPGWRTIPKKVRLEFQGEKLSQEASSEIYDSALMLYLKDKLRAVSNSYLITDLAKIGITVAEIIGGPIELYPCPCCGSRTLDELASYDICRVCWWEDDGQDNHNADTAYGGPNYGISLTQARYNYLTQGIYDPSRKDLVKLKEPKNMYIKRRFRIAQLKINLHFVHSDTNNLANVNIFI